MRHGGKNTNMAVSITALFHQYTDTTHFKRGPFWC